MLSDLLYRLRAVFRRNVFEGELDDELRFHLDQQARKLTASGVPRSEAVRQARMALGGLHQTKEECREARGVSVIGVVFRDLRYAVRVFTKNPAFTVVAMLTLAIGIGANTAIFSLVNAVLLRPLPYPDPQQLLMLWGTKGAGNTGFSDANFLDYQEQNHVFAHMATFGGGGVTLTGLTQPERIRAGYVTPEFFDLLQVHPTLGRSFVPEEGQAGRNCVVLLSHGIWERRFGADPGIVGRTISLNTAPYEVIGVLPRGFDFTVPGYFHQVEVWTPQVLSRDNSKRGYNYLRVLARLKPGVTLSEARADLAIIGQHLQKQYPDVDSGTSTKLVPLQEQIVGDVRKVLLILLGAVAFVLLIACANVANLQLARASARHKEISIRVALGAGRRRVIGQMLTESLLLAVLGGTLGAGLAWLGLRALANLAPTVLPRDYSHAMDPWVLACSLALSLGAGVLFGLAPALQSSSSQWSDSLKQGGRTSGDTGAGRRLRSLLMVSEVTLSLVLLTGAGLLIRSFIQLMDVKPGFDIAHVLAVPLSLPSYAYRTDAQRAELYRQAIQRVASLPGVESVGAIDDLPLTNDQDTSAFSVEGRPPVTVDRLPTTNTRSVTPGYFRAMGVPLVQGRTFTDADSATAPAVLLINQALARSIFSQEDPIGKRVTFGLPTPQSIWMTVIGVVGDVRDAALESEPEPEVYQPYQQYTLPYMNVVLRTAVDPNQLIQSVSREIHALDQNLPLEPQAMASVVATSVDKRRFSMLLLSLFAGIALLLATVGIYGVISYSVTRRTGEIGLRMALGARRADVLKLVLGHSLLLTAAGVAAGVSVALGLTKLLSTMLYGVRATDPITLAGVALVLTIAAALASYVPARRAMKVDPMSSLRNE
jgi:predicted permease